MQKPELTLPLYIFRHLQDRGVYTLQFLSNITSYDLLFSLIIITLSQNKERLVRKRVFAAAITLVRTGKNLFHGHSTTTKIVLSFRKSIFR